MVKKAKTAKKSKAKRKVATKPKRTVQQWNVEFGLGGESQKTRTFFGPRPSDILVEAIRLDANQNLFWELQYTTQANPDNMRFTIPPGDPPVYFYMKSLVVQVKRSGAQKESGSIRATWPYAGRRAK